MKKLLLTSLAALLGGYMALAAVAADTGKASYSSMTTGKMARIDDENYLRWTVLVPELYDNLSVAGTITRIDHARGVVGLNTETQGPIELQFRPAALKMLKVGDVVVANLGFSIDDRTISVESCQVLPVKVASC